MFNDPERAGRRERIDVGSPFLAWRWRGFFIEPARVFLFLKTSFHNYLSLCRFGVAKWKLSCRWRDGACGHRKDGQGR